MLEMIPRACQGAAVTSRAAPGLALLFVVIWSRKLHQRPQHGSLYGLRDAGSGVSLLRVITFGSAPSLAQELSTQQLGNVAGEAPEA